MATYWAYTLFYVMQTCAAIVLLISSSLLFLLSMISKLQYCFLNFHKKYIKCYFILFLEIIHKIDLCRYMWLFHNISNIIEQLAQKSYYILNKLCSGQLSLLHIYALLWALNFTNFLEWCMEHLLPFIVQYLLNCLYILSSIMPCLYECK